MKSFLHKFLPRRLLLAFALTFALLPAHAQNTVVRVQTTQGPIDMALLADAPLTVANFLAYVRAGQYTNVMVHRSVPQFVIQAGWYSWPLNSNLVPVDTSRGPVPNEFSPARSNLRGTVAMAKVSGDPNSATSQWFVNMVDNTFLDSSNGGFTVFARVTAPGMAAADRIGALQVVNAGSPFTELPVANWSGGTVNRGNVVLITSAAELRSQSSSDRIFNYLEAAYPQFLSPVDGESREGGGFTYRYYSGSNSYVGTRDGQLWCLVPGAFNGNIQSLGLSTDWLNVAQGAGY